MGTARKLGALVPVALVAILYIPALGFAYRLDDFAWLSLRNTVANGHSLLWALISPQAQGTIRPLGDRLWFLLASSLFGLNPVPFHVLALCTQIGNVMMVIAIGQRLLGSATAAVLAAIFWVINDALVEPMVWASAYNEVLCTFLFLTAFYAFVRWVESRRPLWVGVQISALVLALGTLELAVTFPAVAVAYVFLFERRRWKAVLPSAAVTAAFIAGHLLMVGLPQSGPYRLSFGLGAAANLAHYLTTVLGPQEYGRIYQTNALLTNAGTVGLTAAILVWLGNAVRNRRWGPFFCCLWFVLALAPTLPVTEHATPYYTFLPSIGLAWLAGDALVRAVSWQGRSAAIACTVLYAGCQIPSTLFVRNFQRDRAVEVVAGQMRLARAVRDIRRVQPEGPVFLSGLDWQQFWWGLCYGELTREGFRDLHVPQDASARALQIPPKEWCYTQDFQLSGNQPGRVYDISKPPL